MSLIIYPQSTSQVSESETLLFPVAQAINDYWQPIKTWTTIALVISQYGLTLTTLTITLIAALLIYKLYLSYLEKGSIQTLYNKLPQQNQLLITAVANAQKQGNSTIEGIRNELEKLTNNPVTQKFVIEEIQEAQSVGLIKEALINRNDEPIIQWKTRLSQNKTLAEKLKSLIY